MKSKPDHFIKQIDSAYSKITLMKRGYVWTGSESYSFEFQGGEVLNTKKLIGSAAHTRDLTILDIGTASGLFIAKNDTGIEGQYDHKVTVYGISASEERVIDDKSIPDPQYLTGNAEYLGDREYKNFEGIAQIEFDYIFSSKTFMHLVDPADGLVQAYNKLKPNGILVVDKFTFKGCEGRLQDIINHLRHEGHHIAVKLNDVTGEIDQFCIQRTPLPLQFPIQYDADRLSYVPLKSLKDDPRSDLEKIESGLNILSEILDDNDLAPVKAFNSLEQLLKSSLYEKIPPELQAYCILYVTAKEICAQAEHSKPHQFGTRSGFFKDSSVQLEKIIALKKLCKYAGWESKLILDGDLMGIGSGSVLMGKEMISSNTKINLIRLVACQNILKMDLENFVENKKAFKEMGLQPEIAASYYYETLFKSFITQLKAPKLAQTPVVVREKFHADSDASELSQYLVETSNFMNRNQRLVCQYLGINVDPSYAFTKIQCLGEKGNYSFKILAESNYMGRDDKPKTFVIPADKFLYLMNFTYSMNNPKESSLERASILFNAESLVEYLNFNPGNTGIPAVDRLGTFSTIEDISPTKDANQYKIYVREERKGNTFEIMISRKELSELIVQQQNNAPERPGL
ncbi:Uncharacterised protein [Legionella wadsworthii]|uniref:Methyltransferase domain-containing protein n=1 Tax=Legionella wadsworthii TaxID=28088 RepID=A0A378LN77_9GAMM|nr:methyltransferase domain-containing protein [Legionella wadsworthii]STY28366.1 Uncharacterised protein [Legionella wadsworthii]